MPKRQSLYAYDANGNPVLLPGMDRSSLVGMMPLEPLVLATMPKMVEKINEIIARQNAILTALQPPKE